MNLLGSSSIVLSNFQSYLCFCIFTKHNIREPYALKSKETMVVCSYTIDRYLSSDGIEGK
jgi:hypothetical protein